MSRHGKFYSDLKRGGVYDDDDDYDYDDDDYYDEDDAYEAPTKTKPPSSAKVTSQKASAASLSTDPTASSLLSSAISEEEGDYDLVAMLFPTLRNLLVGSSPMPQASAIVSAIRQANYDVNQAAAALISLPSPSSPKSHVTTPTPTGNAAFKATRVGSTSGAKTLKLSQQSRGGSSMGTPQSSFGSEATPVSSVSPSFINPNADTAQRPLVTKSATKQQSFGAATSCVDDDGKQTCTVILAGHVDSGKSTILGHTLLQMGVYSSRDVEKNEREGRNSGKQSFKYAWLLDQSEEERRRGVTIDAGSHAFQTSKKRVHVLDAPGHKDFVMNMISSATQADVALLVVTAATGEFESGLQHGTKEHLTILKTLGVNRLIIAVNKMDTVAYSKERFDFVVSELYHLMHQMKVTPADVVQAVCPVSGMAGTNLVERDRQACMPWFDGPSLVDAIDATPSENRLVDAPLRLSLQDIQKQTLFCRVESGKLSKGDTVQFVPAGIKVTVRSIEKPQGSSLGSVSVPNARAGDTVELSTSSDTTGIYSGCVGCSPKALIAAGTHFECRIQTLDTLENAILPGALFMMAIHALTVPVTVATLITKMDKSGNWSKGMVKCIQKDTQAIVVLTSDAPLALEAAEVVRALGRFVLRQNGETVAGGLVTKVIPM